MANNASKRRLSAKMPSIDECLFGPSKYFPSHILLEDGANARWGIPPIVGASRKRSTGVLHHFHHTTADIGSLSTPKQVDEHNRKVRGAQMASVLDLEEENRWSMREKNESGTSSITQPSPHVINLQDLRRITSQGIPDEGSLRAVSWRVLLGYLPPDITQWKSVLQRDRALYRKLVAELFIRPEENEEDQVTEDMLPPIRQDEKGLTKEKSMTTILENDQTKAANEEAQPAEDNETERKEETETSEQISRGPLENGIVTEKVEKDAVEVQLETLDINKDDVDGEDDGEKSPLRPPLVKRASEKARSMYEVTRGPLMDVRAIPARSEQSYVAMNSLLEDSKTAQFVENASLLDEIRKDVVRTHADLFFFNEPEANLGRRRYAAIERVLFVWAKLNKGVRYVQGMNEIVGTIYYVLATDYNEDWACEAEADAYFLFNALMVEMRDVFVPDLDDADTGIQGRIHNFMQLLSLHDPEVRCHLDDCGIDASFYCIRWLTTLLSREFILPDTIRLWDSMFASTHKDNFLRYVCVSMVMVIRDELLRGDFSTCLRLLQSYPPTQVESLLEASRALWIYESQVTLACHKGGISLQQALAAIVPPPAIIMAYGLPDGVALGRQMGASPDRKSTNTAAPKTRLFRGFRKTTK